MKNRRDFLKTTGLAGAGLAAMHPSIGRALALPAKRVTGTIRDVRHIVILMQENRSFDHYFGTMKGVRGFGDRHPIPLAGGKPVWRQSNGERELSPFHLDTSRTSAIKVPVTPHAFADAQAAWDQGKLGHWPKYKTDVSMGHYRREDIPFQFALAEAFTLCDAYHCSVTTGTDPNRIVFWSGSNFDPEMRARGVNCRDTHSEPNNLRCWVKGALPEPGYTYQGTAFDWPTLPDVLEAAGIDWRIYQDPNDNFTGAMHGGLAFRSFREAKPGSPIYERGMRHWSLDRLAEDAAKGMLPTVSWVLPPQRWCEHPGTSSPLQGAEFTARVLDALTANPETWSGTVFLLAFDENDGQFDHLPPPAPPSYNPDGTLAGKSTLDLAGHYFDDYEGKYRAKGDSTTGSVRPWGLGPRVPFYVVSPWSKGGWVNSQVFDHTSVGRFLEARFGVTVPAISPWHRAVSGDLLSCFDFEAPDPAALPPLPDVSGSEKIVAAHRARPKVTPPDASQPLFQEAGLKRSRALPYRLHVDATIDAAAGELLLDFVNEGEVGAVFHVYDKRRLDLIPRRYTVEPGKSLRDGWPGDASGAFDLWALGPNGFVRSFEGRLPDAGAATVRARYDADGRALRIDARNNDPAPIEVEIGGDAYRVNPTRGVKLAARSTKATRWPVRESADWYDLTVMSPGLKTRLAGRLETGRPGVSDPLIG